ncbi:MAG: MaoC family dehydratase N-terminal domain-containing protein [Acidimicrobiia bacterium]|nr:MaoC family dehydratase N-terminal domain-containing protein [Acidimicrobiia bacterium]
MLDITTPLDLQDATLGPVDVAITADRVALYVDTTGDDPAAWTNEAPPGFASVLLFAIADLFLYDPSVVPFTATLLHLDQSFRYEAPMRTDSTVTVEGRITRVRERSGSYFVTFEAVGRDGDGEVMRSVSTFVLSDQRAPRPDSERDEPPARFRPDLAEGGRAVSRHDLVRYAASTRDFNPLHWDHETAVEAGLPGTVVHGLLMVAWLIQDAVRVAERPVREVKVRFRSALHPGEHATVEASLDGDAVTLSLVRDATPLITGTATVAADSE